MIRLASGRTVADLGTCCYFSKLAPLSLVTGGAELVETGLHFERVQALFEMNLV